MATSTPPQWVVFFYLNDDAAMLRKIAQLGASPDMQILVQQNGAKAATRYILPPEKRDAIPAPHSTVSLTTATDPIMLVDFLQWALETTDASQMALVCQLPAMRGFTEIASHHAATIEAPQLQQILSRSLINSGFSHIDLLFCISPTSQYIEIGNQLADTTTILLGTQSNYRFTPDDVQAVLARWQQSIADAHASPETLAEVAVATHTKLSALNLNHLNAVTCAFDALTMALLQSLGDDIIWHAIWDKETETLFPGFPAAARITPANIDLTAWLTFLQRQLSTAVKIAIPRWYLKKMKKTSGTVRSELRRIARKTTDPASLEAALDEHLPGLPEWIVNDYRIIKSQRHRATNLADMAGRIIALLKEDDGLVRTAAPTETRGGVSIHLPQNIDRLTESDYLSLDFCQHTHWTALLGGINLIAKHPRALWRLSSSLLTTASSGVRENVLRRLIGPESVMVGFRKQFRALANPAKLTLTLEPLTPGTPDDPIDTADTYRLRLESPETGATVLEQHSRVNPQTIESALEGLQTLLQRGWVNSHRMAQLDVLGRTLGEDIIQDLADNLNKEYRHLAWLSNSNTVPHLQLQLPRQLMRYPWELLHDGVGLLLERYALGRQVFMESPPARATHLRPSGGVRALIIGDPLLNEKLTTGGDRRWQQLPGAREEAEQMALVFAKLQNILGSAIDFRRERDTRIRQSITRMEFRQLLRSGEYDIIHFAGHAIFNPEKPEQSAWLFSDGALWAQEIHNTLEYAPRAPWLVYANACEAAMEDSARQSRYQGDVFGLATAFINQGVSAYIAPLWRINDTLAAQMAIDFYHALLLNSASLGEALRFARLEAKLSATGTQKTSAAVPPLPAQIGLGWASMVLYGDPTARPLDSLWTPHHLAGDAIPETIPARATVPHRPKLKRPQYLLQASVEETLALVTGPGMTQLEPDGFRGASLPADGTAMLELVEVNGIRCWQSRDPETGKPVPLRGSVVPALREADAVRQVLGRERGFAGYVRTIGRWIFRRDEGDVLAELGGQYDRDIVPVEKLWLVNPDTTLAEPGASPWWWVDGNTRSETDRILLILHGTFSKSKYPVQGLGAEFLQWASRYYRGIIAYDHWTVSKSPLENARDLWAQLDERLRKGDRRIDILAHSRGGLIARALVEMENRHRAINRVVFVATPNSGSSWVDPQNWGNAADHLVNMLHLDDFGLYGRLSAFFARMLINERRIGNLVATINRHLPGLQAQNPQATAPTDFLGMLQAGNGPPAPVKYTAIAANYEPPEAQLTLGSIISRIGQRASDAVTDSFLAEFNDLVVDTPRVWAVDTRSGTPISETVPWLPGNALLVYNPKQKISLPSGAISLNVTGVHHSNVLYFRQSRNFLRDQLTRPLD